MLGINATGRVWIGYVKRSLGLDLLLLTRWQKDFQLSRFDSWQTGMLGGADDLGRVHVDNQLTSGLFDRSPDCGHPIKVLSRTPNHHHPTCLVDHGGHCAADRILVGKSKVGLAANLCPFTDQYVNVLRWSRYQFVKSCNVITVAANVAGIKQTLSTRFDEQAIAVERRVIDAIGGG